MSDVARTGPGDVAGRTRITVRALSRLAEAIAADAVGVDAGRAGATITDDAGELALTVALPAPVPDLRRVAEYPPLARPGGPLLERAEHSRRTVHDRFEGLSGHRVSRVDLVFTAADIEEGRRVR